MPTSDPERDPTWQPYDYYLIFDVEATCEESNPKYNNEIIEFPIILIDGRTQTIVSEFHRYVRPILNPTLTPFCTSLTGITQQTVDAASPFPQVLQEFEEWLTGFLPPPFDRAIFATDGPWDIRDFVKKQLKISELSKPSYFAKRYINVRQEFAESMVIDVGYRGCWNILGWSLKGEFIQGWMMRGILRVLS